MTDDAPVTEPFPTVECPHAKRCAGCPRISEPYDTQLAAKHALVQTSFRRFAESSVAIEPVRPAPSIVGYRTRAKLVCAPGPRLGLYAQERDHVVVDIPECRVLAPAVAETVAALRALLRSGRSLRPSGNGARGLQGVDVRETVDPDGTVRTLGTLVVDAGAEHEREALETAAAWREASPNLAGVAIALYDRRARRVLGSTPRELLGTQRLRDSVDGSTWVYAAPGSFAQVHRGQARAIIEHVCVAIERTLGSLDGRSIEEWFSGSGAIGLALARKGARVVMVESFVPAADAAREAALAQGLRVESIAQDVASYLADGRRKPCDAVVVNPPRRGLAPEVREALGALGAKVVVYVSCDPDTLARDLDHLARLGLSASVVQPFDMIPLSNEVEAVAVLTSAALPVPKILYEDSELIAVDAPAHESTTPQGEREGSLVQRVRQLPGCANAVPLRVLDRGTSGVCLFAKSSETLEVFVRALEGPEAESKCVALCRGIIRAKGTLQQPLHDEGKSRPAKTRYRRTNVVAGQSLLEVWLDTHRRHQIRRHLAAVGHPILGDERYGHEASNRHLDARYTLDRPFLHASSVAIVHPRSGERVEIVSPLAGDLATVLSRMGHSASDVGST